MEENNQRPSLVQNPSIEQSPPPSPHTEKPKLKLPILIAGVVVVSILSVYSIMLLGSKKAVACPTDAKVCPDGTTVGRIGAHCEFGKCPVPSISPVSADPTANWKIYSNTLSNFSLKYPRDWGVGYESEDLVMLRRAGAPFVESPIQLWIYKNTEGLDLLTYLKTKIFPGPLPVTSTADKLTNIKVGSMDAVRADGIVGGKGGFGPGTFFGNNKVVVGIVLEDAAGNPAILNQIISTFKFTNNNQFGPSPTVTTNTKIYSSQYMTFRYPQPWNPTPSQSLGGATAEALNLGIPGNNGDNSIGFYSPDYSTIQINDAVSQKPITIGGRSGMKYIRKSTLSNSLIYSYDYMTTGYQNTGSFSLHVSVPALDTTLETQLDNLVATIVFK